MDREAFFARRMHTPDDPERAQKRTALREVSKALIPLHRSLIDAAKIEFAEATQQDVPPPTQLLQLINDDPFFAWLKPMTSLIVDIDEMASVDFTPADIASITERIDRMFGEKVDSAFAEKYLPILQRDIDVTIGHAAVRKAAAKLR